MIFTVMSKKWRQEHKQEVVEYNKKYYVLHKQEQYDRIKKRKNSIREWMEDQKSKLKCEKCGINHIAVLQFHHSDPKEKDESVSSMVYDGWSKERILKEIQKCKVLCANCHFILHWNENNF